MAYYQSLQIMGLVGREPEFRITDTGPLAKFSVCVEERIRSQLTGDKKEIITWFNCSAWGQAAEYAHKKLRPGTPVFIEGRIRTRKNPKDGLHYWDVTVETLRNLTQRKVPKRLIAEREAAAGREQPEQAPVAQPPDERLHLPQDPQ